MEMKPIGVHIVGTGGHAISTFGLCKSLGIRVLSFISPTNDRPFVLGARSISIEEMNFTAKYINANFVVAIGNNHFRAQAVSRIEFELGGACKFPALIHATSSIEYGGVAGKGSLLFPGTRLGTQASVSDFCVLNTNSSIDHESKMDSFSSIGPGTIVGGRVIVGRESAILMNSSISNNITIGDYSVVAANSFININIGMRELWAGSPGRFVRTHNPENIYY